MQKPAPVVWNPACLVELTHASVDVRYACLAILPALGVHGGATSWKPQLSSHSFYFSGRLSYRAEWRIPDF